MAPSCSQPGRRAAMVTALMLCAMPCAPATVTAQGSPSSAVERRITAAVDARSADALGLLRRLVDINSGTLNRAGVRAVGDVLRTQLDSLGFTTAWVDGTPFERAGHVVAVHAGRGPKILLIGHLDTVFEPSSPFQRFTRVDDSTARGPGIIDMKGGDVIIVQALHALKDAGRLDALNVTVVYDGDEEEPGHPLAAARQALVDAGRGAAYAIGFEDGPGDPRYGVISRRGAGSWTLTTTGVAGHSSQIFRPEIGAGAVNEAARIVSEMYQKLSTEPYLTFNPGLVVGGTAVSVDSTGTRGTAAGKTNVVAERATITGDIRTLSPEQLGRARQAMMDIASHHLPKTTAEITFDDGYPPMAPTDGNRRLLAMYDGVSRDLGFGPVAPVDPSRAGAADVAFIAAEVPMVIDGVGLSGHDDHSEMETADLRMLPVQTKRAAVLLYRLSQTGVSPTTSRSLPINYPTPMDPAAAQPPVPGGGRVTPPAPPTPNAALMPRMFDINEFERYGDVGALIGTTAGVIAYFGFDKARHTSFAPAAFAIDATAGLGTGALAGMVAYFVHVARDY